MLYCNKYLLVQKVQKENSALTCNNLVSDLSSYLNIAGEQCKAYSSSLSASLCAAVLRAGLQLYEFYCYSFGAAIPELEVCPCFATVLAVQFHHGASCFTVATVPCASVTVLAALIPTCRENTGTLLETEKQKSFFSPDTAFPLHLQLNKN